MAKPPEIEYAGFRYTMEQREGDEWVKAYPVPGQHPAANKEKHRRAAREIYEESQN